MKKRHSPPPRVKFANVNILEVMEAVVDRYVLYYRTDFYDYDIQTIRGTAGKTKIADRRFLWLPRPCGTYLFSEIDVMTRIPERKAFDYYFESRDDTLLFGIEARCGSPSPVRGDVFVLDYGDEYQRMKELSFRALGAGPDRNFYEAAQWAGHRRMAAFPDGDLAGFLGTLPPQHRGAA